MQDKIAEHIAKFNAPKDAEFFWIGNSEEKAIRNKERCNLHCLQMKCENSRFMHVDNIGTNVTYDWSEIYTLKHEQKGEQMNVTCTNSTDETHGLFQKGEQMKSIELSEEKYEELIDFINGVIFIGELGIRKKENCLNIIKNAKPIPTEPRFSLDEIRDVLRNEGWESYLINGIIERLKTPKPGLRDRTFKEKLIWLSEQENCEDYYFKRSEASVLSCEIKLAKVYAKDEFSTWLPIPQIEIESEK